MANPTYLASPQSVERVSAEHEARGLLNLIRLVEHCAKAGAGTAHAAQWAQEAAGAREQLERLYAAGLPRDFLDSAPRSLAVHTAPLPSGSSSQPPGVISAT